MSGHEHLGEHLDCSAVIARVYHFLDNELDEADVAMVETHIVECGPCLEKYDLERTVKALVARACCETAPESLRNRVLTAIRQVEIRSLPDDA